MARGHWTRGLPGEPYRHLQPGVRYRVLEAFEDFDGDAHAVGESWIFMGSNYLPYHGGLSLFISLDGTQEWHIRMQDEVQAPILEALERFIG